MPDFNISNKFGGLKPADRITNIEKLSKIIDSDTEISDDIIRVLKKRGVGVSDIFKGDKIFKGPFTVLPGTFPTPTIPTPTFPTPATPKQPQQPTLEIDTKLQLLISSIPIANPGNIITSEYHNALRDAVRALASRIGLSVNPTAEFKILTFSPNFLPTTPKDAEGINLSWDVTVNRAALPQLGAADLNRPVSGGFVVQLPDSATLFQMIARGTRLGAAAPNPKDFSITLKRMKFGKEQSQQTLISMDLNEVKDGAFEAKESVKLLDSEADLDNEVIAGAKIFDRKIVNNEAWLYFVTAEWTAGADTAAKFEINSIQILCMI
ncbi:MAG: hypothetical protein M3Q33_07900 [Acidobacteriota bacterium]|nr:hypothetical protein [Acidobacteriota bacterium]